MASLLEIWVESKTEQSMSLETNKTNALQKRCKKNIAAEWNDKMHWIADALDTLWINGWWDMKCWMHASFPWYVHSFWISIFPFGPLLALVAFFHVQFEACIASTFSEITLYGNGKVIRWWWLKCRTECGKRKKFCKIIDISSHQAHIKCPMRQS